MKSIQDEDDLEQIWGMYTIRDSIVLEVPTSPIG